MLSLIREYPEGSLVIIILVLLASYNLVMKVLDMIQYRNGCNHNCCCEPEEDDDEDSV